MSRIPLPRRCERALAGRAVSDHGIVETLRAGIDLAAIEDDDARAVLEGVARLLEAGTRPARAALWAATGGDSGALDRCSAEGIEASTDELVAAVIYCASARAALRAVQAADERKAAV